MPTLDFVELLVENGAEITSVPLADVLLTWEPKLIRFFLDRGADPIKDSPASPVQWPAASYSPLKVSSRAGTSCAKVCDRQLRRSIMLGKGGLS